MASDDAFGFLDPKDIIRACHTIPGFSSGNVHEDVISLSKLANDAQDWRSYYIDRYVQPRWSIVQPELMLIDLPTGTC
jgi:hypothetical protein